MALDRAALAEFVDTTDKVEPPVFVGRDDVFDKILKAAGRSWNGTGKHGLAGATQIIQGAPGAGKSTILAELARRAKAVDGGKTQVLTLSSGRIGGAEDILKPLATLVGEGAAKDFLARVQTTRSGSAQLGALGSSVGGEHSTTTALHPPEPTLVAFHDWVRERDSTGAGLTGPIIVAIDEAQNMRSGEDDPRARILRCIHEADPPLPLILVLAGLGDTGSRAMDMGLTRGKTFHAIGVLTDAEVTDLTHRWCAHFGLDPTGSEDRLAALARPCEGWPRHLHFALQALGREALATEGVLADVDWEAVSGEAAASRFSYYQEQQNGALKDCAALVGAVLHDLKSFHGRSDVIDRIERHQGTHPGRAWQIPKGMDADSLADHLFHRGALQVVVEAPKTSDPEGVLPREALISPIPSFRSYLVREGAQLEVRALLAGEEDEDRGEAESPQKAAGAARRRARQVERILAATAPHTEKEIIHWTALTATWCRYCGTLAAIREKAAAFATPDPVIPDADHRARSTTILSTLDNSGGRPPSGVAIPALPRSLPHAERAVAALGTMMGTVRKAAQTLIDGTDDDWTRETLGTVMALPDRALAATPEDQLAWAIEHLMGDMPPHPDTPPSPGESGALMGV